MLGPQTGILLFNILFDLNDAGESSEDVHLQWVAKGEELVCQNHSVLSPSRSTSTEELSRCWNQMPAQPRNSLLKQVIRHNKSEAIFWADLRD